jgi:hypothetical protein
MTTMNREEMVTAGEDRGWWPHLKLERHSQVFESQMRTEPSLDALYTCAPSIE